VPELTHIRVLGPMLLTMSVVVFAFMLIEAWRSARNERAQRLRGGVEPRDDVYSAMRIAYPGAFLAMLIEGAISNAPGAIATTSGAALFGSAKALKWWAIWTLGPCWTFRVIVVPGMPLAVNGPYRWMRHPNYVGVVGELAGVALMAGAAVTGPLVTLAFVLLLSKRIAVESRALDSRALNEAQRPSPTSYGSDDAVTVPDLQPARRQETDHHKRAENGQI
jgi:methyltransferase